MVHFTDNGDSCDRMLPATKNQQLMHHCVQDATIILYVM